MPGGVLFMLLHGTLQIRCSSPPGFAGATGVSFITAGHDSVKKIFQQQLNLQEYIDNGMVESYVLGLASPEEASELEHLLKEHPELRTEVDAVERTIQKLWLEEAVLPPVELRERSLQPVSWADTDPGPEKKPIYNFINIQHNQSNYITVHKIWKWIFVIAFLLFKFCLFLAIYFYFKYRQVEDRQHEREKIRLEQQQSAPK